MIFVFSPIYVGFDKIVKKIKYIKFQRTATVYCTTTRVVQDPDLKFWDPDPGLTVPKISGRTRILRIRTGSGPGSAKKIRDPDNPDYYCIKNVKKDIFGTLKFELD